ncbi:MAG: hypothetical protein D4S01_07200 [Dehalococcoidia bacterium]|nr:MAG: hypothetical protein D4S01_07200 [Dehalococcoidia bacterium]
MKSLLKSFLVVLILMAVLTVPLIQLPKAYSAELTAPEKTLIFLKDIVKIDVTKYTATLARNWVDYPPHWGGLAQEVVRYNLEVVNESRLYVTCRFRENMLYSCSLQVLKGSPIFAESQPTNLLDSTKRFLERYQAYSGASYLQAMHNMLDTVNMTKDMTITSDNVKLTTSSQAIQNNRAVEAIERTSFEWTYTVNGVDAPQNVVRITFDQGVFKSFRDNWSLCRIGSSNVNVSMDEAITLARNAAEDYTLQIYLDDGLTDVEFNLVDEPVKVELFMYPKETLTVYPFWRIKLYFDKLYYSAYGIVVGIWADTKQIEYCESLSYTGGPPDRENPNTATTDSSLSPTTSPSLQSSPVPSMNMHLIIPATATIIAIGIATLVYKKKHK